MFDVWNAFKWSIIKEKIFTGIIRSNSYQSKDKEKPSLIIICQPYDSLIFLKTNIDFVKFNRQYLHTASKSFDSINKIRSSLKIIKLEIIFYTNHKKGRLSES